MTVRPDLNDLERSVLEKFIAARHVDWPLPDDPFDSSSWLADIGSIGTVDVATHGAGEPVMQFPREQWIVRPNLRLVTLMLVDRALDMADRLTDEQWAQVTFLLSFGGKERIA